MLGLLAGWFTGQWDVAVPLGIVLELFWLDVIPLGAVLSPTGALPYLLTFSMALLFGIRTPDQLVFPLFFTMGCAYVSVALERRQRVRANALAETMVASEGRLSPDAVVYASLAGRAMQQGALYVLCFGALYGLLRLTVLLPAGIPVVPGITWNVLFGVGSVGALLALRTRRAYAVLGVCLIVMLVMRMGLLEGL